MRSGSFPFPSLAQLLAGLELPHRGRRLPLLLLLALLLLALLRVVLPRQQALHHVHRLLLRRLLPPQSGRFQEPGPLPDHVRHGQVRFQYSSLPAQ